MIGLSTLSKIVHRPPKRNQPRTEERKQGPKTQRADPIPTLNPCFSPSEMLCLGVPTELRWEKRAEGSPLPEISHARSGRREDLRYSTSTTFQAPEISQLSRELPSCCAKLPCCTSMCDSARSCPTELNISSQRHSMPTRPVTMRPGGSPPPSGA